MVLNTFPTLPPVTQGEIWFPYLVNVDFPAVLYPDPDYRAKAFSAIESSLRGETEHTPYWEITRKDGVKRTVVISTSIITYQDHEYLLGRVHDITDMKHIEIELEQAKEDAQVALLSSEKFSAMINHELRTPTHSIMSALSLLNIESFVDDPEKLILSKIIEKAAANLAIKIDALLDFNKRKADGPHVEIRKFSVISSLESIIDTSRPLLSSGVILNIFVENNFPEHIIADASGLELISSNLIGNAVKYTSAGEISAALKLNVNHKQLSLTVKDTGAGLNDFQLKKIFDPFYRADGAMNSGKGGVGLGLALVKETVAQMKGEITVKSTEGEGSTFTVVVPIAVCETWAMEGSRGRYCTLCINADTVEKMSLIKHNLANASILLVEDDKDNILLLKLMLQKKGLTNLTEAVDGKMAIKEGAKDPDIILLDMNLPDMTGFDVLEALRKKNVTSNFIAVTADTSSTMRKQVNEQQIGFVEKPINLKKLMQEMSRVYLKDD